MTSSPNITRRSAESAENRHLDSTDSHSFGERTAKISVKGVASSTLKETLLVLGSFVIAGIIVLAFLAYITAVLG